MTLLLAVFLMVLFTIQPIANNIFILIFIFMTWGMAMWKLMTAGGQVLTLLLTLEIFMLSSLIAILILMSPSSPVALFFFMLLTMAVCEASVGLSVLISFARLLSQDSLGLYF